MATRTNDPPPGGYGLAGFSSEKDRETRQLSSLRRRIDLLQKLHVTLFLVSLFLLVLSWAITIPLLLHITWALTLGGSVLARVKRQALVSHYNELISIDRPAPLA